MSLLFVVAFSCTEDEPAEQVPETALADLGKYNMKIIPDFPGSGDEVKLVISGDCRYNKLSGVTRSGKVIDVVKQFNSMIMAPCVLTNDTILIGKLSPATYRINYRLVDIAVSPGRTTFAVSFMLPVSK